MILWIAVVLFFLLFAVAENLFACAVCFGDPNSHLTLGAFAGVVFLFGIIFLVIGGIFAVAIFWMRRARLLEVQALLQKESSDIS
jgi:hypothetical protein